jgi:hypothetical protein
VVRYKFLNNKLKKIMKKMKAILTLGALMCAFFSYGQYSSDTDVLAPKIGVKGGVNFSNLNTDNVADEHTKVGFNLGLFAKLPVSETFAIQPEILYSNKGSKLKYDNFVQGEGEYRFNLNYLELPVLAVVNIGPYFNIHAGPYVAFLSSSNIKDMNDDGTIQGIKDVDVKNFNRFDYGLAAGIGADLNGFMVGARYNYGLNEVGKSGSLTGQLTNNAKNSVASIYIGFGF